MRVQLTGRLAVEAGGTVLGVEHVRGRQGRIAFACLAWNHDRAVSRADLADALWDGALPRSWPADLSAIISRLRRALARAQLADAISSAGGCYELRDVRLDVDEATSSLESAAAAATAEKAIDAAMRARDIAGRPLMPGDDCAWLDARRAELEEVHARALDILVSAYHRLSRLSDAILACEERLAIDRFHEPSYRTLIELYAAAGRRPEALRVWERCRRLLRDELGMDPAAETESAYLAVLRDDGRRAVRRDGESRPAAPLPPALRPPADPPFVGRDAETACLREAFASSSDGLRAVLLFGDAGVGKTRLMAEFAAGVPASVLYGHCDEESLTVYQPFVELLERCAETTDVHRHAGRGAAELARLSPALAARVGPPAGGETSRFRQFDAVASFLGSLAADGPLVLVIDDLHDADKPSLLMLRHVARELAASPVLVVAAVRDAEMPRRHVLGELVADLRRRDVLHTLHLRGLREPEVAALVTAAFGDGEIGIADHIARVTEGNPLFVREFVRAMTDSGVDVGIPEGIKDVIGCRLDALAAATLRLVSIASVIGREFDMDVLAHVARAAEDRVLDAMDEASHARIIEELPGALDRYAFTHALVRETLYERLGRSRRARTHRAIADALVELRRADPRQHLSEVARHYAAAGPASASKACTYARAAGERAMSQLAYEDAAEEFDRALASATSVPDAERIDLLVAAADAHGKAGEPQRATAAYLEALDLSREQGRPEHLARAALGLSSSWVETGIVDATRTRALEEALTMLPDAAHALRALVTARLAHDIYADPDSVSRRLKLADDSVALARRAGDSLTIARCLDDRTLARMGTDIGADELVGAGNEIAGLASAGGDAELAIRGMSWQLNGHLARGDIHAFDTALDAYARAADELRHPRYVWYAQTRYAMRALYRGDLDEGAQLAAAAREFGLRHGEPDADHVFHIQMSLVWGERLDTEGLERFRAHAAAIERQSAFGRTAFVEYWQTALLRLETRFGEVDRAHGELLARVRDGFAGPASQYRRAVLKRFGDIAVATNETEAAVVLYELLAPHAGSFATTSGAVNEGVVDDALAGLAGVLRRIDDAVRHSSWTVEFYDRTGAKALAAHARRRLALALHAAGRAEAAGRAHAEASEAAERMGLVSLVTGARQSSPEDAPRV